MRTRHRTSGTAPAWVIPPQATPQALLSGWAAVAERGGQA